MSKPYTRLRQPNHENKYTCKVCGFKTLDKRDIKNHECKRK